MSQPRPSNRKPVNYVSCPALLLPSLSGPKVLPTQSSTSTPVLRLLESQPDHAKLPDPLNSSLFPCLTNCSLFSRVVQQVHNSTLSHDTSDSGRSKIIFTVLLLSTPRPDNRLLPSRDIKHQKTPVPQEYRKKFLHNACAMFR
jgi:hypothetical protein